MATSRQQRLSGEENNPGQEVMQQTEPAKSSQELEKEFIQEGEKNPPPPPKEHYDPIESPYNFDALESAQMTDLTGEILTRKMFKDGETKPFFFIGWAEIPDKITQEGRKAAKLIGKDRETYFAPSHVIVSAFEKADGNMEATAKNPIGCKITSNGMKEGKTNSYWDVRVMVV